MASRSSNALSLQKVGSLTSTSSLDESPSLCSGRTDSVSSMGDNDDRSEQVMLEVVTVSCPQKAQENIMANQCDSRCSVSASQYPIKRKARELLSVGEKKEHHIVAEQKRRNTIRVGFKELSDILPTLNNRDASYSKSTILFKAVDYIQQLIKRNKMLRDRIHSLQIRTQLHTGQRHPYSSSSSRLEPYLSPVAEAFPTAHEHPINNLRALQTQLRLIHRPGSFASIEPIMSEASYLQSNCKNVSSYRALVVPVEEDYSYSTPCVNIPADEEYEKESAFRERLLSCGKLKIN